MLQQHFPTIRSFVSRGRITAAQKKAFLDYGPHYGLRISDGLLAIDKAFGRSAPTVLDIGFGMGDALISMAKLSPAFNFIGIDVHKPGVGKLLRRIVAEQLDNIRFYCADATEVLSRCFMPSTLDRITIYFPDPWPKKKHHKRRLIQADFVQSLVSVLKCGGTLHLATDCEAYAQHMLQLLSTTEQLHNQVGMSRARIGQERIDQEGIGAFAKRPNDRPLTAFERRGQRLGNPVRDLLFVKQRVN